MATDLSIKQKRMMKYFIEAAYDLMEESGDEPVTIRKIADKAGYNVSTVYNYFRDQEHLMVFASVKYLSEYAKDLNEHLRKAGSTLEQYRTVYDVFLDHAFKQPKVFYNIFFGTYRDSLGDIISEYAEIFPDFLSGYDDTVVKMMYEGNIYLRDKGITNKLIEEKVLTEKSRDHLTDLLTRVFQSLLTDFISSGRDYTPEGQKEKFFSHFDYLIETGSPKSK